MLHSSFKLLLMLCIEWKHIGHVMPVMSVNWPLPVFQIQRGKYHGLIDTGLAVITFKPGGHRMDIDAEEQIYHIKVSIVWDIALVWEVFGVKGV